MAFLIDEKIAGRAVARALQAEAEREPIGMFHICILSIEILSLHNGFF